MCLQSGFSWWDLSFNVACCPVFSLGASQRCSFTCNNHINRIGDGTAYVRKKRQQQQESESWKTLRCMINRNRRFVRFKLSEHTYGWPHTTKSTLSNSSTTLGCNKCHSRYPVVLYEQTKIDSQQCVTVTMLSTSNVWPLPWWAPATFDRHHAERQSCCRD